jgi:hypothetical protein
MNAPAAQRVEAVSTTRYAVAVHAIAAAIATELDRAGLAGEDAWDRADTALLRQRDSGPHRWVFDGLEPILQSSSVFDALEPRPDGSRDWVQGSVASAAEAVVRFDVFRQLMHLRDMTVE